MPLKRKYAYLAIDTVRLLILPQNAHFNVPSLLQACTLNLGTWRLNSFQPPLWLRIQDTDRTLNRAQPNSAAQRRSANVPRTQCCTCKCLRKDPPGRARHSIQRKQRARGGHRGVL